ncbi:hypothetical protein TNCV_2261751 [Trichonephila clavipes]|nr:hypothetical protein TNCV_2261751 [Trichonephila clavipes]
MTRPLNCSRKGMSHIDSQYFSKFTSEQENMGQQHQPLVANFNIVSRRHLVAAVSDRYRYRIVACLVTSWNPVPLKTRRVVERCSLNLSRAETRPPVGVVVRRGGASSSVCHVT